MFKKSIFLVLKTTLAIVALYFIAVTIAFATSPSTMNDDPIIVAHRGASGSAPENTLLSIAAAIEKGADYIEIDIHLSKDNAVMVIHDHTIDRTTNGTGDIANLTQAEIQQYDAGSWFYEKEGLEPKSTHVPTLKEVLELINGQAVLLIEVKKGEHYYEGIEQLAVNIVNEMGAANWVEYQSFNDPILENLLAIDPKLKVHKLIVGKLPLLPIYHDGESVKFGSLVKKWKGRAVGINPNHKFASSFFINRMHKNGMTCITWTVNDDKKKEILKKRNIDGLITNYP